MIVSLHIRTNSGSVALSRQDYRWQESKVLTPMSRADPDEKLSEVIALGSHAKASIAKGSGDIAL